MALAWGSFSIASLQTEGTTEQKMWVTPEAESSPQLLTSKEMEYSIHKELNSATISELGRTKSTNPLILGLWDAEQKMHSCCARLFT